MNKICYTALCGPYEDLKPPTVPSTGWDFVCFTDQPLTSDVWQIVQLPPYELTPQRMARRVKLLPHIYLPTAEYTMWVDAAFQINIDLNKYWDRFFKPPFSCPSHPIRNDVYREIDSCIANGRGDVQELTRQKAAYKAAKVPNFRGIITSGILLRQSTSHCQALCNDWWAELERWSVRDQVAFARVSPGHRFHTFNWDYTKQTDLKYIKHFHKR